jgi:preprotein translocase subunit YajC
MTLSRIALALAGQAPSSDQNPFASLILMIIIFSIFYFVLILPMRTKQKKLEETVKALKTGDKVIVSPGIFATIVAVDEDAFHVRVDEKTKLKVLKSAIAGLQGQPLSTEK